MFTKNNKKFIKKQIKIVFIKLRIWSLIKRIFNKDIAKPINDNLLLEGKQFYSEFIKPGNLVFDVGANYGNRVEIFLALNSKIIAIEPQQKCAAYLRKIFSNLITVEQIGLGSKNEIKQFYEADNSVLSTFSNSYIDKVKNTRHKTAIWKKSNLIEIKTLDTLIEKYGIPVFIKIDVEGYEYEVLRGLSSKAGTISFEYNVPELTEEVIKCIDKLHSIGYTNFNFSIGESMVFKTEWYSYADFIAKINSDEFNATTFGDIYAK